MRHSPKISVSVMCSDLLSLGRDIETLERLGVDMLHVDVMDAHFVPNLTFGPDFIKAMQRFTRLPVDCHFMVTDPELMFSKLTLREGDIFTAHVELTAAEAGQDAPFPSDPRSYRELASKVHASGAIFGLAVNPETHVEALEPHLDIIDRVTLMLVHPGFAGAKMVEGIMEKVAAAREFLDSNGRPDVEISVDGSVSAERAAYMAGLGASIFVGGTAGIYRQGLSLDETIPAFRRAIEI